LLEKAGITLEGKRGPHTFRYARAVSLLRASVPVKTMATSWATEVRGFDIPYLISWPQKTYEASTEALGRRTVFLAGTESGSLKAGDFKVVGRLDSMRIAPVN